jgi:CheY-like chemotaxis protein
MNNKIKILTIDDDQAITSIFKRILTRSGEYDVKEENFSHRAYLTALEYRPDVVLLDWQMPIMNGAEVAAQLIEDPDLCNAPIIFVTGFGQRAAKFGRPCLEKPVTPAALLACIGTVIKTPSADGEPAALCA